MANDSQKNQENEQLSRTLEALVEERDSSQEIITEARHHHFERLNAAGLLQFGNQK